MNSCLLHFQKVVSLIEQNSWWAANFGPGKFGHQAFVWKWDRDHQEITEVPQEPFESLLLQVRKLTMNDGPEQLLKVKKALKNETGLDANRELLDVWQKYWRLAFIKEPCILQAADGKKEIITGYRAYDAFINGRLFHSNDQRHNVLLYGHEHPVNLDPMPFLENLFHATVANLCLAALGLDRFIKNKCTFDGMVMTGAHLEVFHFMLWRKQVEQLDEQYKVFSDWIEDNGGCKGCRWG